MEKWEEVLEAVSQFYPDSLKADGFNKAIIGYAAAGPLEGRLIYSIEEMIKILRFGGMTEEEAVEYLEFNTINAWVGEHTPIFMRER